MLSFVENGADLLEVDSMNFSAVMWAYNAGHSALHAELVALTAGQAARKE